MARLHQLSYWPHSPSQPSYHCMPAQEPNRCKGNRERICPCLSCVPSRAWAFAAANQRNLDCHPARAQASLKYMIHWRSHILLRLVGGVARAACIAWTIVPAHAQQPERRVTGLEVVARLQQEPNSLAVTPDNRIVFSTVARGDKGLRMVEAMADGTVRPFPTREWA